MTLAMPCPLPIVSRSPSEGENGDFGVQEKKRQRRGLDREVQDSGNCGWQNLGISRIKQYRKQYTALVLALSLGEAGKSFGSILKEGGVRGVAADPAKEALIVIGRVEQLGK
ncbi:hypothetical protein ABIA00_003314 [Bradyrhizobium ottawaense]|uniref:hypothetical protein n=1 Tax=Bradyrhizobium ottawaense TaxID=931866 RepID=UPI003837BDE4